jgi:hypothetical protein
LANLVISGNTATDGGGICNYHSSNNMSSSAVLTNVTISGNSVSGGSNRGGGILNYLTSPVLSNVTISGNSPSGIYNQGYNQGKPAPVLANVRIVDNVGIGIYNNSWASPVLINVTISGNSGRGIWNRDESSPVLANVAIFGNTGTDGGGMYNEGSSPVLFNATSSGNKNTSSSGGGGGIYNNSGSSPKIKNSIIWGNTAAGGNVDIDGGSPTITYSIVNGMGYPTSEPADGDGNKGMDPLFADWKNPASSPMPNSAGVYSLTTGSPAINAGDNALYPLDATVIQSWLPSLSISLSAGARTVINAALGKDLAGKTRKVYAIDMGAYEKE